MPPFYSDSTIVLLPDLCNNYKLKQCCSRNNRKIIDSHSNWASAPSDQGSLSHTSNLQSCTATPNATRKSKPLSASPPACDALERQSAPIGSGEITPPATPCKDPEQENRPKMGDLEQEVKIETKLGLISRSRGKGSYKKRRKRKK